ncbi:MAG: hypothetical protein U0354_08465 [Candidatus Sericytochromatia bacterium]
MKKNFLSLSLLLALSVSNVAYASNSSDLPEDLLDIPINLRSTVASKNVLSLKRHLVLLLL